MIDDKTGLEILSEQECWDLLASSEVGRIGVSIANEPEIFPINYKLHDQRIYMNTVAGTKLAAAILGPGVAFEVDNMDSATHTGWSVLCRGQASEVTGTEELLAAEDLGIRTWTNSPKARYMVIDVTHISGRRIPT